jgi:hypothetical protein
LLTVAAAKPAGEPSGALAVTREGARWRVQGMHRGQKLNVTIDPTDALPVITIA